MGCIEKFENAEPMAYCIYSPLALGNLEDLRRDEEVPLSTQLVLMHDYLKALTYLHEEKKVMHRDIKPLNLGVSSLNPPTGVVFDFDSATLDPTSNNHMHGTISFLAPEIVDIKRWDEIRKTLAAGGQRMTVKRPPSYGRKVDIWALGLTAFLLYTRKKEYSTIINNAAYSTLKDQIESLLKDTMTEYVATEYLKLISQMMEWDPLKRLSAVEALRAEFWAEVPKNEPKELSASLKRYQELDISLDTYPTKSNRRRSSTMRTESTTMTSL